MWASSSVPSEAGKMFQVVKFQDKHEGIGLPVHVFSTLDRVKKRGTTPSTVGDGQNSRIERGEVERTIGIYVVASTKFEIT